MLTVTHGRAATRRHILVYTLVLAPFALALALSPVGGPVTLAVAVVLNLAFIAGAIRILGRDEDAAAADGYRAEKAFFRFSLFYLFVPFRRPAGRGGAAALGLRRLVMAIHVEHDLHERRRGRNHGLGLVLLAFVALIFGLTVVKVSRQDASGNPPGAAAPATQGAGGY